MNGDKDMLKLENQLCFPLYACAKEVIKKYKPYLDEIGLTYTQYIAMMVIWEKQIINVKSLGEYLYLDSGTLTPLLKKLEMEQLITRQRSEEDERNLVIKLTPEGKELKKKAAGIPEKVGACVPLSPEETRVLYRLLYQILNKL